MEKWSWGRPVLRRAWGQGFAAGVLWWRSGRGDDRLSTGLERAPRHGTCCGPLNCRPAPRHGFSTASANSCRPDHSTRRLSRRPARRRDAGMVAAGPAGCPGYRWCSALSHGSRSWRPHLPPVVAPLSRIGRPPPSIALRASRPIAPNSPSPVPAGSPWLAFVIHRTETSRSGATCRSGMVCCSTSPVRTVIDIAGTTTDHLLERILDDGITRRLWTAEQVAARLVACGPVGAARRRAAAPAARRPDRRGLPSTAASNSGCCGC